MSFVTWNDLYQQLWMQAAHSRGTVTSVGELPSASRYSTLPEWPRTTGADVIAIASLVDPILNATPLRPGGYGITRVWQAAVIEIEGIAFHNPVAEYVHNRAFWSTLLAVAAHLDIMGASVPEEEAWESLVGTLWSPSVEYRNASGPTSRAFASATFADMWEVLRAEHVRVRGFDVGDDELGGTIEVPRTTNADVLQLEGHWGRPFIRLQLRVMTGAVPTPNGFEDLQLEWQAVTARVQEEAARGKPAGVYPGNLEFWRASRALATALDLLQDRPAPYIVLENAIPAPATPSNAPAADASPAKPKADLSSRLNELADNALTAFAHVVNDAGSRLVTTVGKPLLFTGATLAALLLILRATAPCDCDPMPAPEAEAG